jgi:threonine dehydratase
VLAGIQVSRKDDAKFGRFLRDLGYRHWDESRNPAYRLFLA